VDFYDCGSLRSRVTAVYCNLLVIERAPSFVIVGYGESSVIAVYCNCGSLRLWDIANLRLRFFDIADC
jgi:hypothetical protein